MGYQAMMQTLPSRLDTGKRATPCPAHGTPRPPVREETAYALPNPAIPHLPKRIPPQVGSAKSDAKRSSGQLSTIVRTAVLVYYVICAHDIANDVGETKGQVVPHSRREVYRTSQVLVAQQTGGSVTGILPELTPRV